MHAPGCGAAPRRHRIAHAPATLPKRERRALQPALRHRLRARRAVLGDGAGTALRGGVGGHQGLLSENSQPRCHSVYWAPLDRPMCSSRQ